MAELGVQASSLKQPAHGQLSFASPGPLAPKPPVGSPQSKTGKGKPNAVPCLLCGQLFFSASMRFHQKQCAKRQCFVSVPCPNCELLVPEKALSGHLRDCVAATRDANELMWEMANDLPLSPVDQDIATDLQRSDLGQPEVNSRCVGSPTGSAEPSFERTKCPHCSRFFALNRIQKHTTICGNLRQARPRGPNGEATQETARVFDSAAARMAPALCTDGGFERARQRCFIPRSLYEARYGHKPSPEAGVLRKKKRLVHPEIWRLKHEEFVTAVRKARRGEYAAVPSRSQQSFSRGAQVPCPYCGRKFAAAVAERHVPKCLHTINRGRKTPSRLGDGVATPALRPQPLWRRREPEVDMGGQGCNELRARALRSPLGMAMESPDLLDHPAVRATQGSQRIVASLRPVCRSITGRTSPGAMTTTPPDSQPQSQSAYTAQNWHPAQASKPCLQLARSSAQRSTASSTLPLRGGPLPGACGERVLHALNWSAQSPLNSRKRGRSLNPVEAPRHSPLPWADQALTRRPGGRGLSETR